MFTPQNSTVFFVSKRVIFISVHYQRNNWYDKAREVNTSVKHLLPIKYHTSAYC